MNVELLLHTYDAAAYHFDWYCASVVPKRNDAVRVIEALGHALMVVIQPVSLYKWNLSHHPP